MEYHNFTLVQYYGVEPVDYEKTLATCLEWAKELVPLIADVTTLLHEARARGESILFEGAQGSLLDIDHGTYPYVTSSNTTAGAAASVFGVGPFSLDYVLGITMASTTRGVSSTVPTVLGCAVGQHLGERGHEFGATTGRKRRCGWFAIVAVRHANLINSVTGVCLTKLDGLNGLDTMKICIGYQDADGNPLGIPHDAEDRKSVV